MNQTMTVDLYGASIADMEGTKYVSLFLGQQVENEKEENAKGIVIMKMPCDPDVYESLRFAKYPVQVELSYRLKKAAQGRLGQFCTGVKAIDARSPIAASANKPSSAN
ncbi:hypothetical protein [Cellvibrio sp. UBA7661]|uniref:hypothetical protein n=1 Tax=Cellvibrio sp. UBA7661 TaxID=1946311 RepID=UPI002F35297E